MEKVYKEYWELKGIIDNPLLNAYKALLRASGYKAIDHTLLRNSERIYFNFYLDYFRQNSNFTIYCTRSENMHKIQLSTIDEKKYNKFKHIMSEYIEQRGAA